MQKQDIEGEDGFQLELMTLSSKGETYHFPVNFDKRDIFMLVNEGQVYPENDRGILKAVLNGYSIDTKQFVMANEKDDPMAQGKNK